MARTSLKSVLLASLSASPAAMAQCIPLQGSTTCSAFQSSSVSTDSFLVGLLYVFLLRRRCCLFYFAALFFLCLVLLVFWCC